MTEIRVPGTESWMYPNDEERFFRYQDRSVHGTYWNGFWYAKSEKIAYSEVLRLAIENDQDSYHFSGAIKYLFEKGFITEVQYKEAGRSLILVYQQVEGNGHGTHLSAGTLVRAKIVAQNFANEYPDTDWEFRAIQRDVYWNHGEKGEEIAKWTCSGPVLPKTKAEVSLSKALKVLKAENLEALEGARSFEVTMPNSDGEKCWFVLKWVDSRYNEPHSLSRKTDLDHFEETARWACAYLKEHGLYLDLFRHFNEDGSRWPHE